MLSDEHFIFEANFKANSQNLKGTEDVQHYFISLLHRTGVSKNKNFCGLQLLISSLFFNSRMVNNEAPLSETFKSPF